MLTCFDVAKYFLTLADDDASDSISNMKLQKLVYYAQGLYLALHGRPLFNHEIEAWTHGPVVPDLYHLYKEHGSDRIPCPEDIDFSIYDNDTKEFLNEVYDIFGQYSAWKLRNMTHEEPPWKEAAPDNDVISHDSMKQHFRQFVVEEETA